MQDQPVLVLVLHGQHLIVVFVLVLHLLQYRARYWSCKLSFGFLILRLSLILRIRSCSSSYTSGISHICWIGNFSLSSCSGVASFIKVSLGLHLAKRVLVLSLVLVLILVVAVESAVLILT